MTCIPRRTDQWDGVHTIVVYELAGVEQEPGVDGDEVGPVELPVREIQRQGFIINSKKHTDICIKETKLRNNPPQNLAYGLQLQ